MYQPKHKSWMNITFLNTFKISLILIFIFLSPSILFAENPLKKKSTCGPTLTSNSPANPKLVNSRQVMNKVLLPTFGERIRDPKINLEIDSSSITIPAIKLPNSQLPAVKIQMSKDISSVHHHKKGTTDIINIPFQEKPLTRDDEIMDNLISNFPAHPLHPYIKSSYLENNYYEPKPPQVEGAEALETSIINGYTEFGFIAPTGVGKSDVLFNGIEHMHKHLEPGLIIVTADQVEVVDQLLKNLYKQPKLSEYYQDNKSVFQWNKKKRPNINELAKVTKKRQENGEFTILFTTVRTLNLQALPGANLGERQVLTEFEQRRHLNQLSKITKALIYDEVHHAGAPEASSLISQLKEKTKKAQGNSFFFYGTTATPFHYKIDLIYELFNNNIFMGLLDNAKDYFTRDFETVKDQYDLQLIEAMKKNYVRSVSAMYLLIPGYQKIPGDLFEIVGGSQRFPKYAVSEKHFSWLMESIVPKMKEHDFAYISASNIDEAKHIHAYLQLHHPDLTSKPWHSKLTGTESKDTLEEFKNKKFRYLITVGKLDEAIDLPFMSLWIDFNRSLNLKQMLQRLGRVIRLHEGKRSVEVISLFDFSIETITDKIAKLNSFLNLNYEVNNSDNNNDSELLSEIGLELSDKNIEASMQALAKSLQGKANLNNYKHFFYNAQTNTLDFEKTGHHNLPKKQQDQLLIDWNSSYGSLPKPYVNKPKKQDITPQGIAIYNLVEHRGGIGPVSKELGLPSLRKELSREQENDRLLRWHKKHKKFSRPYAPNPKKQDITDEGIFIYNLVNRRGGVAIVEKELGLKLTAEQEDQKIIDWHSQYGSLPQPYNEKAKKENPQDRTAEGKSIYNLIKKKKGGMRTVKKRLNLD